MKILFLTDNFPPEVNAPAIRTYEHCREWVKSGADVTVITCAPNFPQGKVYPGYRNKLKTTEWVEGIKVIRVWTFVAPNKGFTKRILDYLTFMVTSFLAGLFIRTDLIIATSPQLFTAISGMMLSLLKRKSWIMEVRDLWPDSIAGVEAVRSRKILNFFYRLEKILYQRTSMIIPVTETFKKVIIAKGIDPSKIHVITNGADLNAFNHMQKQNYLLHNLGLDNQFVVGYIGTHGMAHGLDFFIRLAPGFIEDGISFLFIGDGARKEELLRLKQQVGANNLIMLDPVPRKDIPAYLSILNVSLIPLRKVPVFFTVIPSKIFESAAMGIPILLGVDGESRHIVERYKAGLFFEPEHKDQFLSCLFRLKNDEKLSHQCREGGFALAKAYDRKRLAGQFFTLLNQMQR